MTGPGLIVLRPGLLTTVQDLGRWGHQDAGVPVAGPMDVYSHRLANRLVGNVDGAAALEVTLVGPELQARGEVVCVVTGAVFDLLAGERPVECGQVFRVPAGGRLRFGSRVAGTRATIAIRGGIDVAPILGSRATSIVSRMGPFGGRPVAGGDVLPVGTQTATGGAAAAGRGLSLPSGGARLRAIPGPHASRFTHEAVERFFSGRFRVTPQSNRMGYRLEGPELPHGPDADILSDATPLGSVQVPKAGQPILLMADRQTTGGYPKIATVIAADIPTAAQLAPGDWIQFAPCTRAEAVDALSRLERRLTGRTP